MSREIVTELQDKTDSNQVVPDAAKWYEQITLDDAKTLIRQNIASASRSFIAVGYYLKFVRDKTYYIQAGYDTIWDFADAEYGISKSTASRYMTMNDRFSKDGNSPIVADGYREFGKSQLQEMLYLTDEQIEQVTPETQVKQIRELRRSEREIPYIEIPGQLSITDFPAVLPEPMENMQTRQSGTGTLSLEDFRNTSEDESTPMSCCEQYMTGLSLYDSRLDEQQNDETIAISQQPEVETNLGENQEKALRWGAEPVENVLEQSESVTEVMETAITGAVGGVLVEDEYTPQFFLEEQSYKLNKLLEMVKDEKLESADKKVIERQKTIVSALASMVADFELIEFKKQIEAEKPKQPELPRLKNNDERKRWIENFETWGLWYRDENIDVDYYKYDFDNGTRLIATVYPRRESYWIDKQEDQTFYHLIEKGKQKYGGKKTYDEKYVYNATSVSEIMEYLKKIQKKE